MLRSGRPVRAIAERLGLQHEYTRKLVHKIACDHGETYTPIDDRDRSKDAPFGITDASRGFRRYLADKLYSLGDNTRKVAIQTGVTQRDQKYALVKPFNHDWTLSQIERLAIALNVDLAVLLAEALNAQ